MQPFVSVIMPTYHSEKYLAKAIASILDQTYKNLELIIVSDETTEREHNIIVGYCCADSRVSHIENQTKLGLVKSLNLGISAARGKYIARMDADDFSYPQRIEKQVSYMEAHPEVGICGTGVIHKRNDGDHLYFNPSNTPGCIAMMIIGGCPIIHPSVVMRSDFIHKMEGPYKEDFQYAEDYFLWIRCIGKTEFHNLQEPLLDYCADGTNICSKYHSQQQADLTELRDLAAETIGFPQRGTLSFKNYLDLLVDCNNRKKILEEKQFNRIIWEAWYNYCLLQTHCGLFAWDLYWGSHLSQLYRLSQIRKLKFLGACILHKQLGPDPEGQ